jgi:dTDP-4-dehydrorhamnose 3,5-epimerase
MREKAEKIKNCIFFDERGSFSPLSLKLLDKVWVQSNVSVNPKKWTLRGLHFQKGWYSQAKLIKVIKGEILDFVVDLRDDTPSKVEFFEMSEGDEIIVPKGYAHGFITLEDYTVVQYLVDNEYNPSSEGNLVWTEFGSILDKIKEISPEFEVSEITISEKDLI